MDNDTAQKLVELRNSKIRMEALDKALAELAEEVSDQYSTKITALPKLYKDVFLDLKKNKNLATHEDTKKPFDTLLDGLLDRFERFGEMVKLSQEISDTHSEVDTVQTGLLELQQELSSQENYEDAGIALTVAVIPIMFHAQNVSVHLRTICLVHVVEEFHATLNMFLNISPEKVTVQEAIKRLTNAAFKDYLSQGIPVLGLIEEALKIMETAPERQPLRETTVQDNDRINHLKDNLEFVLWDIVWATKIQQISFTTLSEAAETNIDAMRLLISQTK